MTEVYKEQHPLLCELSDEENIIYYKSRRKSGARFSAYCEKSRAQIKGAALIIKHWPDHLSWFLTYWWIGFSMIAVIIFFIYNTAYVVDVVTPMYQVPASQMNIENIHNLNDTLMLPDIFMHTFVKTYEEVDHNFYLQYIKSFAKKYRDYNFNFVVVLNDFSKSAEIEVSADSNNKNAMTHILNNKISYFNENWKVVSIKHISLTNYLENSPLKDYWRGLSVDVLEFLVKCLAIWNKGGIVFDPITLTPLSPNPVYLGKIQDTLKRFKNKIHKNKQKQDKNFTSYKKKPTKTVNNIRDIINALESENTDYINLPQYNLSEADNKKIISVFKANTNSEIENIRTPSKVQDTSKENFIINEDVDFKSNVSLLSVMPVKENKISKRNKNESSEIVTINNMTVFQKHMFQNISSERNNVVKNSEQTNNKSHFLFGPNMHKKNLSESSTFALKDKNIRKQNNHKYVPELVIDINGYFIATKTPCHVFIGTIFSNIKHYSFKDSVKDIIKDELSIFCRGMSYSCNHIDVIS